MNPTTGLVNAISGGTANITYTVGSVSASASLTVANGAAPVVTGVYQYMSVCRQRHADNLHGYRRRGEQLQLVITSQCQLGKPDQ
ncbi:MAG: hypothetical protein U0T56_08120 [Ferruginibacter sp.]